MLAALEALRGQPGMRSFDIDVVDVDADPALEAALALEAQDLFDSGKLPELMSAPDFGNPVPPLRSTLDGAKAALQSLSGIGPALGELFGNG